MNVPVTQTNIRVLSSPPEGASQLRSIPDHVPTPELRWKDARVVALYDYRNANGSRAFLVARVETAEGKRILPLTVWSTPDGRLEWCYRLLPDQRPLYRLPQLLVEASKPVLISEGEKCADAAAGFGDYASVTWAGGCKALSQTDLTPLAGRDVIILPDHDEPGQDVATQLEQRLQEIGAASIRRLDIVRLAEACGLGVQSRHLVDRVQDESVWLGGPDLADVFVWREAVEGLESAREVVGCYEVAEVDAKLIVSLVVETLHSGLLDRPVHPFDLSVGPRVFHSGQPVIDVVFAAYAPEDVLEGAGIDAAICELHTIVGQHRVDPVWHSYDQVAQKLGCSHLSRLLDEANEGKLAGSVNCDKEIELPFGGLDLGDIDMEVTNGVALETLPLRFVPIDVGQARYPIAL